MEPNSFHLPHRLDSECRRTGPDVADEFHKTRRRIKIRLNESRGNQINLVGPGAKVPLRSRPAGSIGLCGGSYCRRPSSGCGRVADCLPERTALPQFSTITAVKHDREVTVEFARRNCSREAEDEQQVKLDGAVEAEGGLQIQLDRGGNWG